MSQLELFQIPSPCIGLCENGPNGYCVGCFRSREERFGWSQLPNDTKRKVIKLCKMRKARWLAKKLPVQDMTKEPESDYTLDLFGDSESNS